MKKYEKLALDCHIRNVMTKLESARLNGVAIIAKTNIRTHTHTHTHSLLNLGKT